MSDQTAAEIKEKNISRMGEPLGAQFSELRQELVRAHIKWEEFADLFATRKERVDLLNRAAPLFFRIDQDARLESLVLNIARLTDPPSSSGKPNLTIQNFPALISDPDLKSRVSQLTEIALKENEAFRTWRKKLVAHLDLNMALKD